MQTTSFPSVWYWKGAIVEGSDHHTAWDGEGSFVWKCAHAHILWMVTIYLIIAQWLNVKIPESCCCQIHLAKSSRFPVLTSPTTDKLDSSFSTHFRCWKKSLWAQGSQVDKDLPDIFLTSWILHFTVYILHLKLLSFDKCCHAVQQISQASFFQGKHEVWSRTGGDPGGWQQSWDKMALSPALSSG